MRVVLNQTKKGLRASRCRRMNATTVRRQAGEKA
jgi:hypothetical protein